MYTLYYTGLFLYAFLIVIYKGVNMMVWVVCNIKNIRLYSTLKRKFVQSKVVFFNYFFNWKYYITYLPNI